MSINIKSSRVGTFTSASSRRHLSVQQFASHVLADKGNYSKSMIKKATFAKNAASWNHN